jgi:hypothetical protein
MDSAKQSPSTQAQEQFPSRQHTAVTRSLADRLDPLRPYSLSPRGWIIGIILIAIPLLLSLLFPLGPDNGLFFVAGQKVLKGAIHYRDIVDIKPPLIYYLYAAGIWLFGTNALSVHILDLILQGATCYGLIRLTMRVTGNQLWGLVAAITYSMLYFGGNFGNTVQPESYVALIAVGILWLLLFRRTIGGFFSVGILIGILFLLKFTLTIILGVVILSEFVVFNQNWRDLAIHSLAICAGYAVIFGLFVLYLFGFHAYGDFVLMQEFTRGYVALQWVSKGAWFKSVSTSIPNYLSDNYSIPVSLATVAGIVLSLPYGKLASRGGQEEQRGVEHANALRLLRISAMSLLALLVTIAIEGKFIPYHFSRFYGFSLLLASFGGLSTLAALVRPRPYDRYTWLATVTLSALLLLFSPFTRLNWHGGGAIARIVRGNSAFDSWYNRVGNEYSQAELHDIAEFIRPRFHPGDQMFAASTVAGLIYYESGYVPDFKILHFAFVEARFAPAQWKDETRNYLLTTRPLFIIVQLRNYQPTLTGDYRASDVALRELPGVDSLLKTDYALVKSTNVFEVYQRNR